MHTINPTTHIYNLTLLADNVLLWRTIAFCVLLYLAMLIYGRPEEPFLAHAPFVVAPLLAMWERARYAPTPI